MSVQDWSATLADSIARVAGTIFDYLPNVVGSVGLLVAGWLVARALRTLTRHVTERGLRLLAGQRLARTRAIGARTRDSRAFRSIPAMVGGLVHWTVLLFFAVAAVDALGLPAVSRVLSLVIAFLPKVLASLVILLIGLWAGDFTHDVVSRAAAGAQVDRADLVGRAGQVLVTLVFLIIAIDQLGIDSTILIISLSIGFAAAFGAGSLAFGLGARQAVANIIAARYVRRSYRPGDTVRVGGLEGRILEVGDTAVLLDSADGRAMVPATTFLDEVSTLVARGKRRAGG